MLVKEKSLKRKLRCICQRKKAGVVKTKCLILCEGINSRVLEEDQLRKIANGFSRDESEGEKFGHKKSDNLRQLGVLYWTSAIVNGTQAWINAI